jgi:hypothetical protein
MEEKSMDDQQRSDAGMAARRKVLGNAWVDKSAATSIHSTPTSSI